jgi:hypothetical protein
MPIRLGALLLAVWVVLPACVFGQCGDSYDIYAACLEAAGQMPQDDSAACAACEAAQDETSDGSTTVPLSCSDIFAPICDSLLQCVSVCSPICSDEYLADSVCLLSTITTAVEGCDYQCLSTDATTSGSTGIGSSTSTPVAVPTTTTNAPPNASPQISSTASFLLCVHKDCCRLQSMLDKADPCHVEIISNTCTMFRILLALLLRVNRQELQALPTQTMMPWLRYASARRVPTLVACLKTTHWMPRLAWLAKAPYDSMQRV